MLRILKELLIAATFVATIFGSAIQQFAPDAWAQILHLLGF